MTLQRGNKMTPRDKNGHRSSTPAALNRPTSTRLFDIGLQDTVMSYLLINLSLNVSYKWLIHIWWKAFCRAGQSFSGQVSIESRVFFLAIKCPLFRTQVIERAMVELFLICSYGDASAMELQTTLNTVCHDSIISYLASLYQMLEFCKAQLICYRNERLANCDSPQTLPGCLHLYETSECVCAQSPRGSKMKR